LIADWLRIFPSSMLSLDIDSICFWFLLPDL
jgi:hypothetical protein